MATCWPRTEVGRTPAGQHLQDVVPIKHGIRVCLVLPDVYRVTHDEPVARLQEVLFLERPAWGRRAVVGGLAPVPAGAAPAALAHGMSWQFLTVPEAEQLAGVLRAAADSEVSLML